MRILAIRGQNLASLAAPFEIDFEAPPLSGVGLFAISGPTGAGKSTILDAMCLALFDTIPRLPTGHGVLVGRPDEDEARRMRNTDVRSILRRGAAEGFAEVDFAGNDGRRYRARWDVRRARRRADGRVQAQQLTLTDLARGVTVGQTKTEVLAAIQDRLGLNFDQFRRSVLLAQGDFAAFLRATADERAGLLERITGTELYSAISREAFRRAGREQAVLDQLNAQRSGFAPLDAADRAVLERRAAAAQQALADLSDTQTAIDKDLAWYQQQDTLQAQLRQAQAQLLESRAAFEAAGARRRRMEQVRSVQPHRSVFDRCRAAESRFDRARVNLGAAEEAAAAAARRLADAQAQHQAASSALDATVTAFEQLKPVLRNARELDTRIGIAASALHDAAAQARTQAARLAQADERVEAVTARQQGCRKTLDAARSWLSGHRQYGPLVREWPRWQRELERAAQVLATRAAADEQRTSLQHRQQRATEALANADHAAKQLASQLAERRAELTAIEAQIAQSPGDRLRQRQQELIREHAGLKDRQGLLLRIQSVQRDLAAQRACLAQADAAVAAALAARAAADADLPVKLAQLAEAESAHRLALATRDQQAQHLRTLLQDEQPCPVCGSRHHPWQHESGMLDEQLATLQARVGKLRQERDGLERQLAQHHGEIESGTASADAARQRVEALDSQLAALHGHWSNLPSDALAARALDDDNLACDIDAAVETLQTELQALGDSLSERDRLETRRDTARKAFEGLREQLDAARERLRTEAQALSTVGADAQRVDQELRRCDESLATIVDELGTALQPFPGWDSDLATRLDGLVERCQTWVRLWREHEGSVSDSERALMELDQEVAEARAEQAGVAQLAAQRREREALRQSEATDLREQRAALLDGQPADEVEAEWERKLAAAKTAANTAEAGHASARVAVAEARQQLAGAEAALTQEQAELARTQDEWVQLQADTGLTGAQLEELLAYTGDWIAAEAEDLGTIDASVSRDRAIVGERENALTRHMEARPGQDRQALLALREANTAALAAATETANAEVFELRRDDEHRARWGELGQAIESQAEKTRLWASLNELVGSADGKKFRVFAQSLTLEALLGFANAHLKDLSHRYRLQRVPGSDLDLQIVDADMGDEIRSVHSLSGGESFLVSLALALALASLSSQRAQVESLFIDEGFGSLDQDALDIAISSLDALQSMGRRVGVISHVQTLVERIGTRVKVQPAGGGRSTVSTVAV